MTDDIKEAQAKAGVIGEIFVFNWLSKRAGASFRALDNWVSSNRMRFLPSLGSMNVDDSLGYDFQFDDMLQILAPRSDAFATTAPRCFVEVKAISGTWNPDTSFFVSKNEVDVKNQIATTANAHCSF